MAAKVVDVEVGKGRDGDVFARDDARQPPLGEGADDRPPYDWATEARRRLAEQRERRPVTRHHPLALAALRILGDPADR